VDSTRIGQGFQLRLEQEISGVKESIATIQDEMVRSDSLRNLVEDSIAQELGPSEIDTIKSEIFNLTRRLDKCDSEKCEDCL
jgi:SMC interacting uncharacterized protein involved in chromosome segregation